MTKYLLAFVAVAALAGCTSASSSSTPPPTTPAAAPSTAPAIPSTSAAPTTGGSMTAEQTAATFGCTDYVPMSSAGQVKGPVATSQGTCSQQGTSYTVAVYSNSSDVAASLALLQVELSALKNFETIGSGSHYIIARSTLGDSLKAAMVTSVQSSGGKITDIKSSHA